MTLSVPTTVIGERFDRVMGMARTLNRAMPGNSFYNSIIMHGRTRKGLTEKQADALEKQYREWLKKRRRQTW